MADGKVTKAIAELGRTGERFKLNPDFPEEDPFLPEENEILASGDGHRLLDLYQPDIALGAMLAALIAGLGEEKQVLSSRDEYRILDLFRPKWTVAARFATVIASLTANKNNELEDFNKNPRKMFVDDAGLSEALFTAFEQGDEEGIKDALQGKGAPGEGGPGTRIEDPDP